MSLLSRPVVIDDTDDRIQYEGSGWTQDISGSLDGVGTYGGTYNHTLHGTQANNSFVFSFQGSAVTVFGTTDLTATYNNTDISSAELIPPWECYIDGISIGYSPLSTYEENNRVLCENAYLGDSSHELTLNISMRPGTNFYIDYIEYTSSINVTDGSVVLVENTDPAISYDSTWQGVDNVANMTVTQGGKVAFNFTGTQLTWMGYIPIEYPRNASSASYSIDNGSPTSFDLVGLQPSDGTSLFNQIFFTTPELSAGSHSMVVTYTGNSEFTPLTLEYIYLTTSSGSSSATPPSSSATSHHIPIGGIVGGVVGGIAAISIAILVVIFWQRRTKPIPISSASSWGDEQPVHHNHPIISPTSQRNGTVQPFQSSSAGLLSSESLTHTQSDAPLAPEPVSDASRATSPSWSGGGYISGAQAQVGDVQRVKGLTVKQQHSLDALSRPNGDHLLAIDEAQPPRYSA